MDEKQTCNGKCTPGDYADACPLHGSGVPIVESTPELSAPEEGGPCCICAQPITTTDNYGVGKLHGTRYHWSCVRAEAATVSSLPVLQDWVLALTLMQQAVLLGSIRGPDGVPKYGACKMLIRWFRRCVLLGSFERRALLTPYEDGGGSFTGPSIRPCTAEIVWEPFMDTHVEQYLRELDALPHHFQLHFMHAAEIVGYKHPDNRIRHWWFGVYIRLVHDMHVHVETEEELDKRLGDSREGWLERADPATTH